MISQESDRREGDNAAAKLQDASGAKSRIAGGSAGSRWIGI